MRILLIQLPFSDKTDDYLYFPLGMGYIAGTLRHAGHDVLVADLELQRHYLHEPQELLKKYQGFELIAISGFVTAYYPLKKFAPELKKLCPGIPLVLGGPITVGEEDLLIDKCQVDIIAKGEGEETILDLVETIGKGGDLAKVKGIFYRNELGEVVFTGERPLIQDLDSIPFPAWDLFDMETYLNPVRGFAGKTKKQMVTIASRGCPASCTYCNRIYGKALRLRSPENIVSEIRELKKNYGIETVYFVDQTMTVDMKWLKELCEKIKEAGLNVNWMSSSRLFNIKDDIYDALQDAGCTQICYGVESGSKSILKNYKKSQEPSLTNKIYRLLKDRNIEMLIQLLIGDFAETEDSIKETAKICLVHGYPGRLKYLTPLPGTELYHRAKQMELISDADKYLTSISDGSWTCDYEKLLLNLTNLPDEEFKRIKEEINDDMQMMWEIRNYVGVFAENFIISLLNEPRPLSLVNKVSFIRENAKKYYNFTQHLKKKYPDLFIDLKYFETPYHFDYSKFGTLKLKGGMEVDEKKAEEIIHYFYQRYGIFGEKLFSKIISLSDRELVNFFTTNLQELKKAVLQDLLLFNFVREKFSGNLIPLIYQSEGNIVKTHEEYRQLISA